MQRSKVRSSSSHCWPAHTSDCSEMRPAVPILLLVALAGFESVLSASLEVSDVQDVRDDAVEFSDLQKREDFSIDDEDTQEEESLEEGNFLEASKDEDKEEMISEDDTEVIDSMQEEKFDDEESATESEMESYIVGMREETFKTQDEKLEDDSASMKSKREHQDIEEVETMGSDSEDMIKEEKGERVFEE